jgi:type III secretion protein V
VRGDAVVGAAVFVILTVVQIVVVVQGGERVAEVAARFALDAMPGQQLAIDAAARGGAIDARQARREREALEQRAQRAGAMDGAMRFVKGDAVAGVVIVLVNLVAGTAPGRLSRRGSRRAPRRRGTPRWPSVRGSSRRCPRCSSPSPRRSR